MIKANELRIGNIINFEGMYCEVKEIDNQGVVVFIKETEETEWIDLFQFTPIPLTEEILLKCGFDKKGNYIFILDKFKIELKDGFFYFFTYHYLVKCKHLHQLQNLYFAITGQELEVNLT